MQSTYDRGSDGACSRRGLSAGPDVDSNGHMPECTYARMYILCTFQDVHMPECALLAVESPGAQIRTSDLPRAERARAVEGSRVPVHGPG